jgi:hypothetical protein
MELTMDESEKARGETSVALSDLLRRSPDELVEPETRPVMISVRRPDAAPADRAKPIFGRQP